MILPEAFAARMKAMLGDDFEAFLAAYDRPNTPALRLNPMKAADHDASDTPLLPCFGKSVPWAAHGFYYDPDTELRPGKHPYHESGAYYIQEASAMIPASLCPATSGDKVLDLCAAPGGKSTQLAAALGGEGLLVANEIHPQRASILSQNIERMGIKNAVVTNHAPHELVKYFPAFFDKIVVDAPCSGEGMFRKEEQAITMWSQDNVDLCAARQKEILESAAEMLAPNGYLTYSTCTFAPEENEGVILDFLKSHPEFEVVDPVNPAVISCIEKGLIDRGNPHWVEGSEDYADQLRKTVRLFPHHADGEGHFAALLYKREEGETVNCSAQNEKKKNRKPEKPSCGKGKPSAEAVAVKLFDEFCREVMGGVPAWVGDTVPCLFGDKLYFVPKSLCGERDPKTALMGLRVLRAGLCAGTVVGLDKGRGRFEPDHALALCAGVNIRTLAVDYDSAVAYLRGETLPCGLRGWHTVSFGGLTLGWGKASDGVMKNHYPKGLRWN